MGVVSEPATKDARHGDNLIAGPDGTLISRSEYRRLDRGTQFCKKDASTHSAAFYEYLDSGHEMVHWIGQQFQMADRLDSTIDLVLQSSPNDETEWVSYKKSQAQFLPLTLKLYMSRAVDQFLVYTSKVLAQIFTTRPETLRSGAQVKIEEVLEYSTMEDLIRALADLEVNRFAYKGLRELDADLRKKIGLALFENSSDLEAAAEAIEVRNIITHNDGVVNRVMAGKVPGYSDKIGQQVDASDALQTSSFLASCARDIDIRAVDKFGLATMSRDADPNRCEFYVKLRRPRVTPQ